MGKRAFAVNALCFMIATFTFAAIGISFGTTPHDGEAIHRHE